MNELENINAEIIQGLLVYLISLDCCPRPPFVFHRTSPHFRRQLLVQTCHGSATEIGCQKHNAIQNIVVIVELDLLLLKEEATLLKKMEVAIV